MRHLRMIGLYLVGVFSGILISQVFYLTAEKEPPEKIPVLNSPFSQTLSNSDTPRSQSPSPSSPSLAESRAQKSESNVPAPSCPVCPCLYSDQILDPPKYAPALNEKLQTNHEGEVRITWVEVPGAKRYHVHVINELDKIVKTYKASRTFIYLKDIPLPPAQSEANYFIRLATVNGKDQEGPLSEKRSLHLKAQASVVAPKIQEIRVED